MVSRLALSVCRSVPLCVDERLSVNHVAQQREHESIFPSNALHIHIIKADNIEIHLNVSKYNSFIMLCFTQQRWKSKEKNCLFSDNADQ